MKGCNKKFWTNYYGSSLMPEILNFLCWHRVKCGTKYFFEGTALCKECLSKSSTSATPTLAEPKEFNKYLEDVQK